MDTTQAPFHADYRNRDNGLIYRMNGAGAPGGTASAAFDLSHADTVDTAVLNRILWADRKGDVPYPESGDEE